MNLVDTITAISTPAGEGGISVIRISGKNAFAVCSQNFYKDKNRKKKSSIENEKTHTVHFGYFYKGNELIDEVLLTVFRNPNSYTGEDVIEISSHGGYLIAGKILSELIRKGARHAEPGEFTKRAFLNGRIDLSQAEAVADLIKAKTDSAHSSSIKQLEGSLSDFVGRTRQEIINIISLVELELDFAEEGLEFVKKDEVRIQTENLIKKINSIVSSYINGKVIREGVNLVIAGRPNSGKSSLFNYLLKTNRAIVSEVPGTTRDYIEESIIINGILFNLTDTAGLRVSGDLIESEGIRRSYKKINDADLILYLIDSSDTPENIREDYDYFSKTFDTDKSLFFYSKNDLARKKIPCKENCISLLDDDSIENLKNEMISKISSGKILSSADGIIITNLRHKICLENVVTALSEAKVTLDRKMSGEFISVDLRNALNYLGEITGEVTNDDILNNIFRNFCIGK
ncbi:MAG: tRNA uridine-5-carboxymethylaminomethyl(34) synthesis GTPase MnmE [Ignavibacteria bacterium]|nr:tRNA uridine-5-carboxymethylaminomethyl(34) synthesis GTPase MnmE [Ignavibacteria bacterium]